MLTLIIELIYFKYIISVIYIFVGGGLYMQSHTITNILMVKKALLGFKLTHLYPLFRNILIERAVCCGAATSKIYL